MKARFGLNQYLLFAGMTLALGASLSFNFMSGMPNSKVVEFASVQPTIQVNISEINGVASRASDEVPSEVRESNDSQSEESEATVASTSAQEAETSDNTETEAGTEDCTDCQVVDLVFPEGMAVADKLASLEAALNELRGSTDTEQNLVASTEEPEETAENDEEEDLEEGFDDEDEQEEELERIAEPERCASQSDERRTGCNSRYLVYLAKKRSVTPEALMQYFEHYIAPEIEASFSSGSDDGQAEALRNVAYLHKNLPERKSGEIRTALSTQLKDRFVNQGREVSQMAQQAKTHYEMFEKAQEMARSSTNLAQQQQFQMRAALELQQAQSIESSMRGQLASLHGDYSTTLETLNGAVKSSDAYAVYEKPFVTPTSYMLAALGMDPYGSAGLFNTTPGLASIPGLSTLPGLDSPLAQYSLMREQDPRSKNPLLASDSSIVSGLSLQDLYGGSAILLPRPSSLNGNSSVIESAQMIRENGIQALQNLHNSVSQPGQTGALQNFMHNPQPNSPFTNGALPSSGRGRADVHTM